MKPPNSPADTPPPPRPDAHSRILIVDYGSQFTQLIARRIREARVYCEIHPPGRSDAWLERWAPDGIVLSGGPSSVYDPDVPGLDAGVLDAGVPVLGICYGMQLMAQRNGAAVVPGRREYGRARMQIAAPSEEDLFHGFDPDTELTVWCSHGDHVDEPPSGFETIAATRDLPVAAFRSKSRRLYGVQFHPEVAHTPQGAEIIANFLFRICRCRPDWTPSAFVDDTVRRIRAKVGARSVICGLSGGVDSSVAAALVHRAVGDALTCIFVDTGLLRSDERERVESAFREHMRTRLVVIDAAAEFLEALQGVSDPERKRRIIGELFIRIFERTTRQLGTDAAFLVQGTPLPRCH